MTEETPLHNALKPSVADIRLNALPMPVYIAAGDAVKTCIRVYWGIHAMSGGSGAGATRRIVTLIISAGNITECSVIPALKEVVVSLSSDLAPVPSPAGVTHQCSCQHMYLKDHKYEQAIWNPRPKTRTPSPAFGERPS